MTIGVTSFPAALDTVETLVDARDLASTTVGVGGVNSSATTIPATSTSSFSPTGIITTEGEHCSYSGKTSTSFTGCTRGAFTSLGGSAAASHSAGALIKQLIISASHKVQNDAIIATQTKVGSGSSTPASAKYLRGNGAGTSAWDDIHSADIATALGFAPVDGITVQVGDADQGTNITTLDLDSAYFAAGTESPSAEYNLTLKAPPIQDLGTVVLVSDVATLPALNAITAHAIVAVDTEAAAASDNLATITPTGSVPDGTILTVRTLSSSRDVTAKNGTGNLTLTDGDFVMGTTAYRLMLVRTGTSWVELARQPLSTTYQVLDAELTALAGLTSAADRLPYFTGAGTAALATLTSFARSVLTSTTAADLRSWAGAVIGLNVQAWDADLDALAGLASAADKLPYFTGSHTAALADISAAGRALIDDADAATMRATIGVQPGSVTLLAPDTHYTWTNMPAGTAAFGSVSNQTVVGVDLSHATQFRLIVYVHVAGVAGAKLRLTDNTSGADLSNVANAADVAINTTGLKFGAWSDIISAAKIANANLQVIGEGGDTVADPQFNNIRMEYR